MTKQEKNEVIEVLKGKFAQYSNFYITDTESLTVAQVSKLRSHCFDKQVEMKVAKNTLIKKALESIDAKRYEGVYDSLHRVTALLFSENPKEPALILSGFRKDTKAEKPELKAAFINGDVFVGDNQLKALTQIKTKNELIGEVIGLLMSPIQRVLGALQNKDAAKPQEEAAAPVAEAAPAAETTPAAAQPSAEAGAPSQPVAEPAKPAATDNETSGTTSVEKPAEQAITPATEPIAQATEGEHAIKSDAPAASQETPPAAAEDNTTEATEPTTENPQPAAGDLPGSADKEFDL